MRTMMTSILALTAVTAVSASACAQDFDDAYLDYPETMTVDQVDTYDTADGTEDVSDPYRWLEDSVRTNADVAAWVDAQNAVTNEYLANLPSRTAIRDRLTELWNYERFGTPTEEGGRYFYTRNDGLQNQSVFYVQDGLDGEPRILLDPNGWSEDGTQALAGTYPGPNGDYVAYTVADGGSDWRTAHIVDVETGEVLDETLSWLKFTGLSWARDGSGFFYSRYPAPEEGVEFVALNRDQAIWFHALGTDQADDVLVLSDPSQPEVGFTAQVSDDGDYLVARTWTGTDGGGVMVLDLTDGDAEPVTVFEGFANNHIYVGNTGSTFFFHTDLDAPNGRVVSLSLAEPGVLTDVIAEGANPIQGVNHVGGALIVETLQDARSAVAVYTLEGTFVRDVDLPGIGSASGFGGHPDSPESFYRFSSFNQPDTIYRYDVTTGESAVFAAPDLTFDPDDYVVEQVFFESTGGVQVPMFIVHRDDVEPNGERPTLLYAYGGFAIAQLPRFDVRRLQWMEMGGVFVLANIRGGSEYGRAWHDAGRLANKQNVFDDFINAGEALIDLGWTSSDHLAIEGRSNGGLLIGTVVNQRPDLFAAALPTVGVMDMLRFNQFTAGRFWVDDYGSPQDPEMFEVLRAYSPYHNIREGEDYPAVLVTTADTDDRVVPGHSFKYTAALQAGETGPAPTLIRIETRAGHGAGTPVSKLIEETADKWAFIAFHTGLDVAVAED